MPAVPDHLCAIMHGAWGSKIAAKKTYFIYFIPRNLFLWESQTFIENGIAEAPLFERNPFLHEVLE